MFMICALNSSEHDFLQFRSRKARFMVVGMIFLVRLVMRREYFLFGLMMLFLDQVVIRWEVLIGFWSGGSARLEIVFDADEDDEEDEIVFVVNGLLFKFEFGSGVGLGSGIGSGFVEIEFKGEEIEPGFG